MAKPKNVIVIVADSLRYDSVYREGGPGVPYLENNAIQFSNARSSGCWTLPATSSMFTGMLPHEHGATSQSRWLDAKVDADTALAIGLEKDAWAAHFNRAVALENLGQIGDAFASFQRAAELSPTQEVVLTELARFRRTTPTS